MRISVNGDWTNAGTIGASVTIFSVTDPVPGTTKQAKITDGQLVVIPLAIPAGTTTADFRLSWREDWGQYPTSDIDLILVRPNGTLVFDGATLNSPEHVALNNPQAGNWLVIIDGFSVPADDKYDLRIALNGKVVH